MNYTKGKNLSEMTKNAYNKFMHLSLKGKVASVMLTSAILGLLAWFFINFADTILTILLLTLLAIVLAIANGYGQKSYLSKEVLKIKLDYLDRTIGEVLTDKFERVANIGSEPIIGELVGEDNQNFIVEYLLPSTNTLLPNSARIELARDLKNRICSKLYSRHYANLDDSRRSIAVQVLKDHRQGLMLVKVAVGKRFIYGLNV